ncbi:hypothetical protein K435DRAFT_847763 [Dendrothele bispora CBS 962.96]|uniref:Transmembrane protein n=1 Tax=Dendrothele bispora (strain CBS 962.96) TaxID=1314807 RepID=A0A4S8MX53_DENBC|nr:hypothetical protein K435DRAFT_847763 [Dendrothele bispora CBS 962.96]
MMHSKRHLVGHRNTHWNFVLIPGTFILIFLVQHFFVRGVTPKSSTLRIEGQWKQVRQALGLPSLQDEVYFPATTDSPARLFPPSSRFFKRHLISPERDSDEYHSNSKQTADQEILFAFASPPALFFAQDALHEPKLSTEELVHSFQLAALRDEAEARSELLALANSNSAGIGNGIKQKSGTSKKGGKSASSRRSL